MAATVHVKNISGQTGEKEVRDFFSFCGKISSLNLTDAGATKSATVTFEKETAAKTALLLDNTQLGPSQVQVTSESSSSSASAQKSPTGEQHDDDISQEDKPRSRIVAEYLAHGYVISDKAIEAAITLDNQHGISTRFTNALTSFDQRYKATEKAQAVDAKYQVTAKGTAAWQGLYSYFEKAAGTPTGQKVRSFYEVGNKQVLDVHNEARHLANLKSGKAQDLHTLPGSSRTQCSCSADLGKCACAPGNCACSSCGKNPDEKSTSKLSPEQAGLHQVAGTERTKCNCAASLDKCPCEAGKCACTSCAKNPDEKTSSISPAQAGLEKVGGTQKTKCNCSADLGKCACAPGNCSCSSCGKNPDEKTTDLTPEQAGMHQVAGTEKTKCNCGADLGKCPCAPGRCACSSCPKNASA